MESQIISLVKAINEENIAEIEELTNLILYNCLYVEPYFYLTLLYKLIFHSYKKNPEIACQILSCFIQFGQSNLGEPYKPMLDYFAIEAFNRLVRLWGWSVVKPCVFSLRNMNYTVEPLFKHIVECIVNQLSRDTNVLPVDQSDLCFKLPREKSYTWGWFSYIVAHAYYAKELRQSYKTNEKKEVSSCIMMIYRKLLTKLRKNIAPVNITTSRPPVWEKMEEEWESILNVLAEYQWESYIINEVANEAANANASETANASASETAQSETAQSETAQSETATAQSETAQSETSQSKTAQSEAPATLTDSTNDFIYISRETKTNEEPEQTQAPEPAHGETVSEAQGETVSEAHGETVSEAHGETVSEAAKQPEPDPVPAKNSWLYSLFGWA